MEQLGAKEEAKQLINAMPDDSSIDDIMYALYVRAKFEKGKRDIEEGKFLSHEEAKQRLQKWLK